MKCPVCGEKLPELFNAPQDQPIQDGLIDLTSFAVEHPAEIPHQVTEIPLPSGDLAVL